MSNQRKDEFVDDIFVYEVSYEVSPVVMVKFHQKPDLYKKVQSARNADSNIRSRFGLS
jgi:hypothetical protein